MKKLLHSLTAKKNLYWSDKVSQSMLQVAAVGFLVAFHTPVQAEVPIPCAPIEFSLTAPMGPSASAAPAAPMAAAAAPTMHGPIKLTGNEAFRITMDAALYMIRDKWLSEYNLIIGCTTRIKEIRASEESGNRAWQSQGIIETNWPAIATDPMTHPAGIASKAGVIVHEGAHINMNGSGTGCEIETRCVDRQCTFLNKAGYGEQCNLIRQAKWCCPGGINPPGCGGTPNIPIQPCSTTPPADTTAPSAINTLAVTAATSNSITLRWTAVGDDGATGTAASYDLRRSANAITSSNFGSATQVTGEPAPAAAGTVQTFTVTGLSAGTVYHFSIKATDDAGNTGSFGNSVSGTTAIPPSDLTPPASPKGLRER